MEAFPRFFRDSTYKMRGIGLRLWTRHFWLDRCGCVRPDDVSWENFSSMRKIKFSASVNFNSMAPAVRWEPSEVIRIMKISDPFSTFLSWRWKIYVLRSEVKVCQPFKKGIVIRPRWERISFLCFPLIHSQPFENFLISSKKPRCWVLPHSAELG